MIKYYDELNESHIDVLREIGNIGAGNAATSLGVLIDETVSITLPVVRIEDYDTVVNALGGAEKMVVSVLINFEGDANGMIMFLLDMDDAQNITEILVGKEENPEPGLSEMKISAIKEIGNILGSAYLGSIAALTNMKIEISIPYVAVDMAGSILSTPVIQFGAVDDKVMFIEESFKTDNREMKSNVILFAEIETIKDILGRMGIEV